MEPGHLCWRPHWWGKAGSRFGAGTGELGYRSWEAEKPHPLQPMCFPSSGSKKKDLKDLDLRERREEN